MLELGFTSQKVIIISLVWAHKLSYLHQFILKFQVRKVSEHRCICVLQIQIMKVSEHRCICVLQISFLPLSTTFRLDCGTVPTAWYFILELFPQRGILFWNCSHSVVYYFGTVPTAWYFILELFPQRGILFWNCSLSVVFYFEPVPTAWYFILELFPQRGIFLFHFIMCNNWFACLIKKQINRLVWLAYSV